MAGIDNNTVLYLRGDSFEDLSPNPKTITNNGVSIDNNCFKFGASKRLVIDNDDAFAFGTGDFTVEMDIYLTSYSDADLFVSNNNYKDFYFSVHNSGRMRFDVIAGTDVQYGTELVSLNQWNNVCVVRKDGLSYLFLNGHLQGEPYSNTGNVAMTSPAIGYHNAYSTSDKIEGNVKNIRVSNIARYTEDYVPQASYNSLTINVTNQTNTNIEFNIEKLGQETINKVEVLVNGVLSETYTDSFDNVNHTIDKSLIGIGNNDITIRVTYDDNYVEEEVLTHTVTVNNLPTSSSLKDVIDRQELLNNTIEIQKNNLKNILVSKNVEVGEENKLSSLIDKVNLLGEYDNPILYLYNEGDECVDITGGWVDGYVYGNGTSLTKGNNYIETRVTVASNTRREVRTSNTIDFTNYSKIHFEGEFKQRTDGDYASQKFLISDGTNYSSGWGGSANASPYLLKNECRLEGNLVHTIDISNITGSHRLFWGVDSGSPVPIYSKIYKIWLEV